MDAGARRDLVAPKIGGCVVTGQLAFVYSSLWSPYGIGQTIIFSSRGFFPSSVFFSSPNLSGRTLDVYHTATHGVVLVRI